MDYPKFEDLNNIIITEKYIKSHCVDFYNYLVNTYPNISWKNKIYCFYHNLQEPPKCPVCGKYLNIKSFFEGYSTYCSKKCMYQDPNRSKKIINTQRKRYGGVGFESKELLDKTKKTNLERYGVDCVLKSKNIKEKIKETNLTRYGYENPMKNKEIQDKSINTQRERYGGVGFESKELMDKTKKTNLERYGVENIFLSKDNQQKFKNIRKEKYGDQNYNNREKAKQTCLEKYGVPNISYLWSETIIDYNADEEHRFKRSCPHPDCDKCKEKYYFATPVVYGNRKQNNLELCTRLLPANKSFAKNTSIELFIHNILDEYNIEYEKNNRKILKGKELDIYIPSKNIAIECNGIYWHSIGCISPKDQYYHYIKWKDCQKLGIELLTFWDYQIYETPEMVEDVILKKLGIKTIQYPNIQDEYIASNDFDFIPEGFIPIKLIPPTKHTINNISFYDCGKTIYKRL